MQAHKASAGLPCDRLGSLVQAYCRVDRAAVEPAAICCGGFGDTRVERIPPMNPADVAQSALPVASADVSLIALFLQAHWIVKAVMLGLLSCSVWVWAIAIEKMMLYSHTRRSMDRFEQVMNVSIAREVERLERRLLVLATVGSAGPFVGLFGTVWGIMSSFQSIAASKNTSLAVVAPGIAEALFATAIGLIAAIP